MWYVVLLLLLSAAIFIIFNLMQQVKQLEAEIKNNHVQAEQFYTVIIQILSSCMIELNRVDKRGSFSSDDEVGFSFQVIKELIDQTKTQIHKLYESDDMG